MDGRQRQTQIYVDGVGGRRPSIPIDFGRLERWRLLLHLADLGNNKRIYGRNCAHPADED